MDLVGYIAAVCTTVAFLPQVIHSIRTKNTEGISLYMYLIFVTGVSLWLVYGLYKNDHPIIAANAVTLLFASVILIMKLKAAFKKD